MLIVGIDPGLSGGLAFLSVSADAAAEEVATAVMPTRPHFSGKGREIDVRSLIGLVRPHTGQTTTFVIERVGNQAIGRKMGATTMFSFGCGFGLVRGALEAAFPSASIEYPPPKVWQKSIFVGMSKGDPKAAALSFASRRFPDADFKKSPRAGKPHDGVVDALCLAEYGFRLRSAAGQLSG